MGEFGHDVMREAGAQAAVHTDEFLAGIVTLAEQRAELLGSGADWSHMHEVPAAISVPFSAAVACAGGEKHCQRHGGQHCGARHLVLGGKYAPAPTPLLVSMVLCKSAVESGLMN